MNSVNKYSCISSVSVVCLVSDHVMYFLPPDVSPLRPSTSVASGIGNGNARRRPVSTYQLEPRSPRSSPVPPPYPASSDKKGAVPKSPFHYPAPSQPAPPPPPRTVSKNADPVSRCVHVCWACIISFIIVCSWSINGRGATKGLWNKIVFCVSCELQKV